MNKLIETILFTATNFNMERNEHRSYFCTSCIRTVTMTDNFPCQQCIFNSRSLPDKYQKPINSVIQLIASKQIP